MTFSVTFDRTSLGTSPLVITDDPTASVTILEDGIPQLARTIRRTYAPASAYIPGTWLLAAVEDAGSLPLSFNVNGTSAADADAIKAELEAATSQFAYNLTLTIDGVAQIWAADPELPQWFADSGMVRAHIWRGSIVIPLNPA